MKGKRGKKKSSSEKEENLDLENEDEEVSKPVRASTRNAPSRNAKSQANRYLAQKDTDESEQDSEGNDESQAESAQASSGSEAPPKPNRGKPADETKDDDVTTQSEDPIDDSHLPPKAPGVQANQLGLRHLSQLLAVPLRKHHQRPPQQLDEHDRLQETKTLQRNTLQHEAKLEPGEDQPRQLGLRGLQGIVVLLSRWRMRMRGLIHRRSRGVIGRRHGRNAGDWPKSEKRWSRRLAHCRFRLQLRLTSHKEIARGLLPSRMPIEKRVW
ncbi:hypothetical protein BT69DRAFT_686669 [Atractiella rhizophila]|nr:hypothetical protein BT69DRAFT_686669 [Atractiella rhizophila]